MFGGLLRKRGSVRGERVQALGDAAWVVAEPGDQDPVRVRELDDQTWLVWRGRRRTYKRLGGKKARSGLLLDRRAARNHLAAVQRQLHGFLADEHIALLLRRLEVNCVLDVGANTGQYAKRLRESGYTGRIVSFEPVREFVEELRSNAADDPDWWVLDCALGDENTTAEINATPGKRLSSLLEASDFGRQFSGHLETPTLETIQIRRLDAVLDEVVAGLDEPRIYLKLDTQGYDLPAFRGAGDRVGEIVGLQSEVGCLTIYEGMPRLPEQLETYEAAGFEISGMYPVSRHEATLRVIEFDMLMVRADAVPGLTAEATPATSERHE